jgi:SHS2 domain-containing protein
LVDGQPEYSFRMLDHTADVGIVARGKDLPRTFASAARAMFEIIAELDNVGETESREVELASSDRDTLLVDWLNELLYLFDAEQLLLCRFDVHTLRGETLKATVYGERVDPTRHRVRMGIKATTYHMLELKCEPEGCEARVIFDV